MESSIETSCGLGTYLQQQAYKKKMVYMPHSSGKVLRLKQKEQEKLLVHTSDASHSQSNIFLLNVELAIQKGFIRG